jgi:hypothetical protein
LFQASNQVRVLHGASIQLMNTGGQNTPASDGLLAGTYWQWLSFQVGTNLIAG